jgi:predicted RNA-binding Zn ribbon-like protein
MVSPAQESVRPPRLSPTPQLLGGALCLDFANTVDAGRTASPRERLFDYADLLAWSRHADLLSEHQIGALRERAEANTESAADVFRQAIALREAIFSTYAAIAEGDEPPEVDLDLLRQSFVDALRTAVLRRTGDAFDWSWDHRDADELDRMLWPIARSAVELLTSPEVVRVKICASGTCRWLFVDASKNAARRWCSMADCGSRAKMRRQYARRRATRTATRL